MKQRNAFPQNALMWIQNERTSKTGREGKLSPTSEKAVPLETTGSCFLDSGLLPGPSLGMEATNQALHK